MVEELLLEDGILPPIGDAAPGSSEAAPIPIGNGEAVMVEGPAAVLGALDADDADTQRIQIVLASHPAPDVALVPRQQLQSVDTQTHGFASQDFESDPQKFLNPEEALKYE
jgi:hypothetical protein